MRPYRNTVRYWLMAAAQLHMPHSFRPFNSTWSFDRKKHTAELRRFIVRLREIADGLETWLDK